MAKKRKVKIGPEAPRDPGEVIHAADSITPAPQALGYRGTILFGMLASLAYGLWGFLEKLTTSQDLVVTNALVYGAAFLLSLSGLRRWRPPSFAALLAGVAGGGINALVLYSLAKHHLILTYPFVSFGSILFVLMTYFFLAGSFSTKSLPLLVAGFAVALTGLILCGVGLSGGFGSISKGAFGSPSIFIGILISILTGIWIFLAFIVVTEQGYEPLIATTWVFLGSFGMSALMLLVYQPRQVNTREAWLAVAAGVFMFVGEYATYKAFKLSPGPGNRLEQSMAALLANAELVPIVILSVLVLREYSAEGIAGSVLVIAGLLMINYSRS